MVRKEKKNRMGAILAFFIAFIMVGSILGYVMMDGGENRFKYKDIKFTQDQGGWSTIINNRKITFDYLPPDVEQINLTSDIITTLINKPEIDTTSLVNDTFSEEIALAQYNMNLVLKNLNVYLRRGFTTANIFNLSVITCEDATFAVPVVYFKQSNQTKIDLDDNCIIAEARNNIDVLRIKDRLLYSMFGIIG